MLSIIVYGRNDAHGYNMHKRVAISLNSMAEKLSMEDDEIIFVDWNTPDAIPTLIEDISDTITPKCLSLLKVIRVRESDHRALSPAGLKRPTIEPYARNIAIRRANPKNQWLLSTNTDMIFITNEDQSLSELVQSFPSGYYQSYRFELPEFIWSTFDRLDAKSCIQKSKTWIQDTGLSKKINLDINGIKAADAPGDFQLAPLQNWKEIRGFPESLVNGWGVDGAVIENLTKSSGQASYIPENKLITVHCNHLRSLTHFHNPVLPTNKEQNSYTLNDDDWGLTKSEFRVIDILGGNARAERLFRLLKENFPSTSSSEVELSEIHKNISYPLLPTLHFLCDYLDLNLHKTKLIYAGFSKVMREALILLSTEFDLDFSGIEFDTSGHSPDFWREQLGDFKDCLLIVDFGHEETELLNRDSLRSLTLLANSIPQLADHLRKCGNQSQVSFIRAINWSLRELVISEFETPLFNNYGMVLTGATRHSSLLSGYRSKPIRIAITSGIRATYAGTNAQGDTKTNIRKYPNLRKFIPRPIKRILYLVLYGLTPRNQQHWLRQTMKSIRRIIYKVR
jgi:hypothetical protein